MNTEFDVLIDVQAVSDTAAGVPNVARNLVGAMLRRGDGFRYFIAGKEGGLSAIMGAPSPAGSGEWLGGKAGPAARVISQHFLDGLRVNRVRPKVYFAPATLIPFGISGNTAKIALIHDLAPFRVNGIYTQTRQSYHRWLLQSVARRADHLVAVSSSTKDDLVEILSVPEGRVSVIPNATESEIYRPEAGELESHRKRLGLPGRYILFVGKIQPRKNIGRLMNAFNMLADRPECRDVNLVIVGGQGWLYKDILETYENSPAKDRIRFAGHVPDADLAWYYRCAEVFAYPSLYEGFGLPILEAMAGGVPVVASSIGAMAEVVGRAGVICDPYDVEALAVAMAGVLEDPARSRALVESGYRRVREFSWENSAEKYAELWKMYT